MGLFSRKPKVFPQQGMPTSPQFQQYPRYESQVPSPRAQLEFPDVNHRPVEFIPDERDEPVDPYAQTKGAASAAPMMKNLPSVPEQRQMEEIPVRQSPLQRQRYPEREAVAAMSAEERDIPFERASLRPRPERRIEQPQMMQQQRPSPQPLPLMQQSTTEDKPLFVKIAQYRDAITTLQVLKRNIQDVEGLVVKLESIRTQEQTEIESAKENLSAIKQKLLDIDKQLFEI